jgi:hypothetical protein
MRKAALCGGIVVALIVGTVVWLTATPALLGSG